MCVWVSICVSLKVFVYVSVHVPGEQIVENKGNKDLIAKLENAFPAEKAVVQSDVENMF